jgi:hypothetical protein
MNPRQKFILLAGIFLVALAALYPPWVFVDKYIIRGGTEDSERFGGYQSFFAPPPAESPTSEYKRLVIATSTRIDTRRLTVEWAAIVLVVTGLLFLLRSQGDSPRGPERPPISPKEGTDQATGSVAAHANANVAPAPPSNVRKPQLRNASSATREPKPPHWAIDDLLNRDWEQFLPKLREVGSLDNLQDDLEPLVFLDRGNPEPPPWLPESKKLSPSERLAWFDELLKRYYPTSKMWPPQDDRNARMLNVLTSLYRMYQDGLIGMLPEPRFTRPKS